jgi:hypothetical protein
MHFEAGDSWEELMEADNQRQLAWLDKIEPWQKDLTWGDTFAVYEPSEQLWAFCRVTPEDEIWPPDEIKNYVPGELAEEKASVAAAWERGFRPCQNFSVYEPTGELADCHVVKALVKLNAEEFECMKAIGWAVDGAIEGRVEIAPEREELTHATIRKMIERVLTPGAVKHA